MEQIWPASCLSSGMILLVTSIARRNECAAALKQAIDEPVVIAENLLRATTLLRTEFYTVAVFDQSLAETEPHETDNVFEHLDSAIPVQINLAICGTGATGTRGESRHSPPQARGGDSPRSRSALSSWRAELYADNPAPRLRTQLQTAGVPATATERLASVHEAARKLRSQLETNTTAARAGGI